jgi:hypothetical protein
MGRALAVVVIAACGGSLPPPAPGSSSEPAAPRVGKRADKREKVSVDPIAGLAPVVDDGAVSWMVPGRILLELGGAPIEAPGGNRSIEVGVLDEAGRQVRVAVRLDHARFSVWTDRGWLLGVVTREQRVTTFPGQAPVGDQRAILKAGARVRRIAQKDGSTHVRYIGAVEVEGWIPDDALADAAPRRRAFGRIPSARKTLHVMPGATFRVEPRWGTSQLGVVANGYLIDIVKDVDPAWVDALYADGEVDVRGFVSRRDPPSKVHRTKDPSVPPVMSVPNDKAASGTCLFSKPNGDPIGYLVGDRDVQLDDAGGGWWNLYVDTPWGAIMFAARGPSPAALFPCAPAGSVPPPGPSSPSAPAPVP